MKAVKNIAASTRSLVLFAMALCGLEKASAQTSFIHAPAFDAQAVELDDRQREEDGELALYGRSLPLMAATDALGAWTEEQGQRVWRLGITSEGALALEFMLDEVVVPRGASLRLLSPAGIPLAEPFELALEVGISEASTPLVPGGTCIMEYREPLDAMFQGRFRISHVVHAYRDVHVPDEREGNCHVNVACSPEGDEQEEAIRATVRISVVVPQGTGWCTGTLMNNTRQDCASFILTAFHCGRQSSTANFNQYKFYFNFQYATCAGGAYSTSQFITGAQLKAYSDDYAPQYQGVGGSDFMLLRTNTAIPDAFQPYWSGWDANELPNVADDGVCIHHPTGAPKRVSSYTQTLIAGHPMGSSGLMSHYKLVWATTPNGYGITEVGSSGAGLFKKKAGMGSVLIGTLTGHSSGMSCTNHSGLAYFGRMSYHWTGNPNAANIKLKPWLDPDNTGTLAMGGSAVPCAAVGLQDHVPQEKLLVYPNPAEGQVTIRMGHAEKASYRLSDTAGNVVLAGEWTGPTATLDVHSLANGAYILQLFTQGFAPVSAPLIIVH